MVSMRSSGAAVFTRQNPFPRDPPLPRSHYSPTRSRKIPKQQKRLVECDKTGDKVLKPKNALSPVRFTPKPISPERHTFPLKKEDPVSHEGSHSVLLCPPTSDECFSESWPSTDLSHSTSSSTSSPCSEAQMYTTKNMVARETTVAKEPSVLAKYIERFRYGKPQSREDRLREAAEEEDGGFWWMSTSPPSSSTPTQASDKHARESTGLNGALSTHRPISKSHVRDMDDLSMLTLSELSHCDPEEPEEILQLQERANRLLQKSEHSLGSGSMPISSEGLGCSDFSSPVSVDEPIRKPAVPTLMASTNLILDPSFSEGPSFHTPAVGSVGSGVRREDDILFQWRLRRKMEQARQSCHEASSHNSLLHVHMAQTVGPNQAHHSHLSNMPLQKSHLAFTPVTLASLDPPTPEPALPISSPSVSRLQPDATIRPQEQPNPKIKPDTLHHSLREKNKIEATSVPPRHHRQIGTQVNIAETKEEHHRRQKSSSPSPQTSESTEGWWTDTQGKKASTVKGKTEKRREKSAPPSRKKKSECVGSPVRARRAKGHEGVSRKAREVSGKSSFQEEGQRSKQRGRSGDLEPSSPIHNALGQVVSEVLFLGVDSPTQCKTPSSSVSSAFTPPPPQQSPVTPPTDVQRPFEVIDQLMQDAEDSDGTEFEDDPLLQVLRRQRKWVKEQLCEVDKMLERFLPLTAPTST